MNLSIRKKRYCKKCAPKYEKIEYKVVKCSNPECNEDFFVDARNMTKCMCDDCYKEYRKKKNLEAVKRYQSKL